MKVKEKFRFSNRPWISLATLIFTGIFVLVVIIIFTKLLNIPGNAPYRPLVTPTLAHIVVLFIITPFLLKLPNGKTTLRLYLDDIRLTKIRPFLPLLILGVSSSLILLLTLSTNSIIFRITEGLPLNQSFLNQMIDLKRELPPGSLSYINSFPAIFEEVLWRGVLLVLFLKFYSVKKSILITALGFGLMHFLNLLGDVEPDFVIRQVIFGSTLGIFYGYLVLKTNSLIPAMLFHYLVNMFIGGFTWYFQQYAPAKTQILYCAINLAFSVPVLILWLKFFCDRYFPNWTNSKPLFDRSKT